MGPLHEVVQVVGSEAASDVAEGELVWSAIGWRGSALLRLRSHAKGRIDRTPCPTCGRTTPRVSAVSLGEEPLG